MKILDRYLVRELVIPTVICSAALVFLVLIADVFNSLTEMLRYKTPFGVILRYYLSITPFAFTQTMPWAAWLGTIFLLVSFGFHNETMAMKAIGLKITTIIRPVLFLGVLLGILTFLISDRLVPPTIRIAQDLKEVYIERKKPSITGRTFQNVTYYAERNRLYYFRTFFADSKTVDDAIVLWLSKKNRNTRQKMIAKHGIWENNAWKFENVTEYQTDARGRILGEPQSYARKTYPDISITPQDLETSAKESTFMPYRELKHSIKQLKANGIHVYSESTELANRLASPWQSLVMMLITVPLLAQSHNRKLIAFNVLLCVLLVFSYYVMSAITLAAGTAGRLFPFASAWLSNVVFAVGALIHMDKANY